MPTATWKSRLRSGSAHWVLELAVEVRQCPLGSGARGGGPAVPTGIWTARRRRRRRWRRRMRRRRRRRTALIKSNNPHLAGGEKTFQAPKSFIFYRQRPASWVDGCRSSRIQSCPRRALHLCDNVRDVTTQAQEAQRPIRLRFKNPCERPWIVEKTFRKLKSFFLGVGPWKEVNEVKP